MRRACSAVRTSPHKLSISMLEERGRGREGGGGEGGGRRDEGEEGTGEEKREGRNEKGKRRQREW